MDKYTLIKRLEDEGIDFPTTQRNYVEVTITLRNAKVISRLV